MKIYNLFNITTTDLCRISFGKFFQMINNIEFFSRAQYQVDTGNFSDFFWFELRITTGDHHQASRCLSLNTPHQLATFLISIIRNRTGIDHIHVGLLVKIFLHKAFLFQHPGKGRGFRKIELTTQCVESY